MKYAKHKANKSLARSRIYRLHLPCRQDEQPSKWRGGKGVRERERTHREREREAESSEGIDFLFSLSHSVAEDDDGLRHTSGWRDGTKETQMRRDNTLYSLAIGTSGCIMETRALFGIRLFM
jgi:hypothetical protein